ncbi:Crotonyl-CoA carboxylase/reductase [Dirofilaria immitis]
MSAYASGREFLNVINTEPIKIMQFSRGKQSPIAASTNYRGAWPGIRKPSSSFSGSLLSRVLFPLLDKVKN